ncbi:DUF4407 domain-containing protein [Variovorax rhizosphaerae]|uniref:DUF4407 domain-containing protein n=1 Tax=Variovorax rhizosphaerae TaxID=1836200 RepID=A0ABU8WP02_9BURK
MSISSYLWLAAGEQPDSVRKWHRSSQRRFAAFGMAIHIPVVLWLVTGYLLASTIFGLSVGASAGVAFGCALLIFMVERLILAVPSSKPVYVFRLLMGLLIAFIGASTVDLVLFEKEISKELQASQESAITQKYDKLKAAQLLVVRETKDDWDAAVAAATAEANGRGGSGRRGAGPLVDRLVKEAELRRQMHEVAKAALQQLHPDMQAEIAKAKGSALQDAGLIERLVALHAYLGGKPFGIGAWVVFFGFMALLEFMVVVTKLAFTNETTEEAVERCREEIARHKANTYRKQVTSDTYEAERLILGAT